ncbi:UDP-N-acetylmuramyl tripeptide synthase [Actinopolyspora xinjiangensis]|uniref:Lipid II isoglutaminyl synthase (glutamine-hydrolyzing) subunit MurT n=1 Tax=Actinopolyspora xinjiangensis TaxID=405564 RepID=A0A1H0RJ08_9ACTN|nr:MurT ligase domain-containing protein [Actinopolyspora xinjiangensis]SDP29431.1 UDP-N-acetylmuramyl tripeptide synthase [Actinopolyspora xinjiangensis]
MTNTTRRDELTRSGQESTSSPPVPGQRWRVVAARRTDTERLLSRLRTGVALTAGRLATTTSKRLRLGSGGIIGGRVAMALRPDLLDRLVADRRIVVVTGTNGKTTTTHMVAQALRAGGDSVSNATGANMLDGHVAALMSEPDAPYAALEVDELHLAQLTDRFQPSVILLLNLSRDQLDRVGEIRSVEASLRRALRQAPAAKVVANADDPNIVSAAIDHPHVTWVSGGCRWKHDALNCPRCGAFLGELEGDWECACGLRRPVADWTVDSNGLIAPDGGVERLSLPLPGQVNRVNATFALAASTELDLPRSESLERIQRLRDASGRYGHTTMAGREVRLLLAKNPASWLEMLDLVAENERPLIFVVNSRQADGHDVSWLWDIEFERLAGRTVLVTGERALDLAVRLRYAEVNCETASSVQQALHSAIIEHSAGPVEIIANYTAFRDLFAKRQQH